MITRFPCPVLALASLCGFAGVVGAQPNPEIQPLFPAGVTVGKATEITLNGTNLQEVTGVMTTFPGKFRFVQDKKTEATQVKLIVEPDPQVPPSLQLVRIGTTRGVSNARVLVLDQLPEVMESGTNKQKEQAQELSLPCVINGKLDAETSRWFRFNAKKGQSLSFETIGRRLGNPIDPQITIYNAQGREIPGGYGNDSPGLQTDARVRMQFKEDGTYLLALRDVSWRGGADYIYRLRIGDFPMATTAFPLAIQAGQSATLGFAGPATQETSPVSINTSGKTAEETLLVAAMGPSSSMAVEIPLSAVPEVQKTGTNQQADKAQPITPPCAINGRLLKRGERDYYRFTGKKGQRVVVDGTAGGPFSPTELYMEILDAKGGKLSKSDPGAAARIDFTPGADGDFTLMVEHVHLWGGPTEAYRVVIETPRPQVLISLAQDRFSINQEGELSLPVLVERKGYDEAFKVIVKSPPGFTGSLEIPKGKPAKPNEPAGNLVVKAPAGVPVGPMSLKLGVEGPVEGKFTVTKAVSASLGNLPFLPKAFGAQAALAVLEKPPFKVTEVALVEKSAKVGQKVTLKVKVARDPGFEGPIALSLEGLPKEVTATTATLDPKTSAGELAVTLGAKADAGKPGLKVVGKSTKGAREFVVPGNPVELTITK